MKKKIMWVSIIYGILLIFALAGVKNRFRPLPAFQCGIQVIPFLDAYKQYVEGTLVAHYLIGDLFFNLILFMPLVVALLVIDKDLSLKTMVLSILSVSTTVEILEIVLRFGSFDTQDILMNILGAIMVYYLCRVLIKTRLLGRDVK
ncbi:VanZ family protein [uncultured Sharpea sp.]|uniref:VanZ family protein n=1 Tax=uncultured Sharpea sp. TaxID=1112738 RepID=UPI00258E978A|nr:VanZ family protein [uncultured Sharpea sp.]